MPPDIAPFTQAQERQLHILRVRGFQLKIVSRQHDEQRIGVAGRDPSNARIVGAINARGTFRAELIDFRPSTVAVSAPGPDPTVEELIG